MSNLFAFGDKVIGGGESSQSEGHIIQNPSGTAMPTQPNLQFADANVENDSTNNATVIHNFVDIDWDDWQEVDDNDNTYYRVTNAPLADGNIEVDLMKKLWENPNPTSSFTAQTVTLASDDYDFIDVYAKVYSNNERYIWVRIQKNTSGYIEMGEPSNNGSDVRARLATLNGTNLTFDSARWARNGVASAVNDSTLIPTVVYGIKQKFTISLSAIISNVSTSAENCMMPDGETSVADKLADTGWLTSDSLQYRKIGSCVWIKGTISSSTSGAWSRITTLPSGFKPSADIQLNLFSNNSNYANIAINTGGYVEARTNVGSIPYIVSFLVD